MFYNQISDFDFNLPDALIAQYPLKERCASRLLVLDTAQQTILHQQFPDIVSWMKAGDVLVLNDTQVIPARLFGRKSSGGKVECLIERVLSDFDALAHLRFSKPPAIGSSILFADAISATVIEWSHDLFHLKFTGQTPLLALLNKYGSIPLPMYFKRQGEQMDIERYQTVYAKHPGAVATPTAGLHFDAATLSSLQTKGVKLVYITLHIGAGTFQPVRVNDLNQHKMHREFIHLSEAARCEIADCRRQGARVFAVGTTVARALETASLQGELQAFSGFTELFIRPGFPFRSVDALLTNFHTPKSTLLMLVAAFGGFPFIMKAYQTAIQQRYRFFSYGDAMLLLNPQHVKV